MNIGIFDSGLGGLSIFREVARSLPEYSYVYLGDNARLPYGGRSPDLIYQYTKEAMDFLMKQDCLLIILACNTATSNALRRLQQEYLPTLYPDRRILGVIRPVVESSIQSSTHSQRIGVLATRATIASESFPHEFKKLDPYAIVFQQACPLLVPIIEEEHMNWEGCDLAIQMYLKPILADAINTLVLGCTHFGLIENRFRQHTPQHIRIISQSKATAQKLQDYLKAHPEIDNKLDKNHTQTFYATDLNERYERLTRLFLGEDMSKNVDLKLIHLT